VVETLIATHVGADFDAVAAVSLARRLWPEAAVFLPGSKQESVRRAVEEQAVLLPEEVTRRQVDPSRLRRVVLCDCRQPDRLGVVAEWLAARPDLVPVIYDHHPATPGDLAGGEGSSIDPAVGSTTTLLCEELARRGIEVGSELATLALLGIYEDTGALTYATTSPRDLTVAAELLSRGADLGAVRRFALGRLDPQRVAILHQMLEVLEVVRVHGVRVGLCELDLPSYVDELAPLVSRVQEMLDLPVAVGIFAEPERVSVIARGALPGCDLGRVLASLGGGGHPTAASASVRQTTRREVREQLVAALEQELPPSARARDLMLASFSSLPVGTTVEQARNLLNRWRVNAAPVEGGGRVVGVVGRIQLDAAAQHGLADRPVERVMEAELAWVAATTPADELAQRFSGRAPLLVLVGDAASGHAEGVITRMMVLRHLHQRLAAADRVLRQRRGELHMEHRSAVQLLERLAEDLRPLLAEIANLAESSQTPVYLVGGVVRDLLLGRENRDLDLVVEGDGPDFARRLAALLPGARLRVHEAFLTATLETMDGRPLVDVATARSEFYRAPAALPEVQTSAIRQDLYRRDFTINALAVRLGHHPELLDFFGGRRDLADGHLRVLHALSFLDDPTRVLRAVRFELVLGFSIVPETLRLVGLAIEEGVFDRLSGGRLRAELEGLLERPEIALRGLERLDELGVLRVLHRRLRLDDALRRELAAVLAAHDWWRLERPPSAEARLSTLLLLVLAGQLARPERAALAARLGLAGRVAERLVQARERVERVRARLADPGIAPSAVARELGGLPIEETLWLMASGEPQRGWVRRWLGPLGAVRSGLRGRDLLALGVPPGAEVGQALAATLDALRDGRITGGDEREFALAWLRARASTAADREPGAGAGAVASAAGPPAQDPAVVVPGQG
jgi:tRNA nucleotidyltransferase (CCA-adding enzyme)